MNKKILAQLQKEMQQWQPSTGWVAETRHELLFFARNQRAKPARQWFLWPVTISLAVFATIVIGGLVFISKPGQFLYYVKEFIQKPFTKTVPPAPEVKGFYTPSLHNLFTPDTSEQLTDDDLLSFEQNIQGTASATVEEAQVSTVELLVPVVAEIDVVFPVSPTPEVVIIEAQEKENDKDKQKNNEKDPKNLNDNPGLDHKPQKEK